MNFEFLNFILSLLTIVMTLIFKLWRKEYERSNETVNVDSSRQLTATVGQQGYNRVAIGLPGWQQGGLQKDKYQDCLFSLAIE